MLRLLPIESRPKRKLRPRRKDKKLSKKPLKRELLRRPKRKPRLLPRKKQLKKPRNSRKRPMLRPPRQLPKKKPRQRQHPKPPKKIESSNKRWLRNQARQRRRPKPPLPLKPLLRNKLKSRLRSIASPSSKPAEPRRKESELRPEPSARLLGELAERAAKVAREVIDAARRRERGRRLTLPLASLRSIAPRPSTPFNNKIFLNPTSSKIKSLCPSSQESKSKISPRWPHNLRVCKRHLYLSQKLKLHNPRLRTRMAVSAAATQKCKRLPFQLLLWRRISRMSRRSHRKPISEYGIFMMHT